MTATTSEQRNMVVALVLAIAALAVMVGDKISNPDIVNRETFDLLQLVFSSIALVCGVIVIVQARRRRIAKRADQDLVIDLRERLSEVGVTDAGPADLPAGFPSR